MNETVVSQLALGLFLSSHTLIPALSQFTDYDQDTKNVISP